MKSGARGPGELLLIGVVGSGKGLQQLYNVGTIGCELTNPEQGKKM